MHEHTNLLRRIEFYKTLVEAINISFPSLHTPTTKQNLLNWYHFNDHDRLIKSDLKDATIETLTIEQSMELIEACITYNFNFRHNRKEFMLGLRLAMKNDTRPITRLAAAEARLIELQQLPTFTVWYKSVGHDDDGGRSESRWHKDTCKPGDFASEKEYLAWIVEQEYEECWGFITNTEYEKKMEDKKRHEMEAMCAIIMKRENITQVDSEEFFNKVEELCESEDAGYKSELDGMKEDGLCGGFGMTVEQYFDDRNFVSGCRDSANQTWSELREYLNEKFPIFAAMMRQKQPVEA